MSLRGNYNEFAGVAEKCGRYVIGPFFTFVGFIGGSLNIHFLFPGATIDVNGEPTSNLGFRLLAVFGFYAFGVLGILLVSGKLRLRWPRLPERK